MITNFLTIDVEDYFQVSAFDGLVQVRDWDSCETRVERNTREILRIIGEHRIHATFFIVGWVAERFPDLVRAIDQDGHEIGCHSHLHRRIYKLTPEQFREDTRRAKEVLEDLTGKRVAGYRAPSYSITRKSLWALDILAELGFEYDSSIFPIHHDLYGIPDSPRFPYQLAGHGLMEYPISTALLGGVRWPVAGGGYFRLFPYWFTKMALKRINKRENKPFMFYLHPWEIDPGQPRMTNASRLSRFRHYNNLDKTKERLGQLLQDFAFDKISRHELGASNPI